MNAAPAPLPARFAVLLSRCKDEAALGYEVDLFKASHAQEIIAKKMGKQLKTMEQRRREELRERTGR